MELIHFLIYCIFIIPGVVVLFVSTHVFNILRFVRKAENLSVYDAGNKTGVAQINGIAKRYNETLCSPIGNKQCFLYEYNILEQKNKDKSIKDNYNWESIDKGEDSVDFIVEDDSGTAYINTDNAKISLSNKIEHMIPNEYEISNFIKNTNLSLNLNDYNVVKKLRMQESTVKPGDDIYVIGKYLNKNVPDDEDTEINPYKIIYISDKNIKENDIILKTEFMYFLLVGLMLIMIPFIFL